MLGEYLLEDRDHAIPLDLCDVEVRVSLLHPASVVLAGSACRLTDEGSHVVLQIRSRHALPRRIDRRISIEDGIWEEGVDEVADHHRNRCEATQPVVERLLFLLRAALRDCCTESPDDDRDDGKSRPGTHAACDHIDLLAFWGVRRSPRSVLHGPDAGQLTDSPITVGRRSARPQRFVTWLCGTATGSRDLG